jgi:two-component sensor histidine kinase
MSDAIKGKGDSIRELLLGMGGSSMRKSYYPELRSKLDDLELFRQLVERSSDAILLFALPAKRLLFANIAARKAFGMDEGDENRLAIEDVMCADPAMAPGRGAFIQTGAGKEGARRFEVVVNEVSIADSRYAIAVARDQTERLLMEERIERDLVEKETMLREIHHRVKNNFQLMKSLLSLEASSIREESARIYLIEAENRIMSMAGAHERLYESPDLSKVDAAAYLEDIATAVRISFRELFPEADFTFSSEKIFLPLEIALPCGLILNELLSNSLKHAFSASVGTANAIREKPARVSVSLRGLEEPAGWACLTVRDNGIGIDASKLMEEGPTVGLTLIRALAAQIAGSIEWKSDSGTEAKLCFPIVRATLDMARNCYSPR